MQQREPGDAVRLVVLTAAPFAVILILFLTALLRCDQKDIPAVMQTLAAVLKGLTRWGKD
jgi:biotin transporter BioY